MPLEVVTVPCLSDNYAYLAHDEATGATAVIDVPEAAPVLNALAEREWRASHILITHHHDDHVAGVTMLAAATGALGGMAAVILLFVFLRARRRRKILEQLPDAMDYLARCVRSGQSLDQAIAEVGGAPLRPLAGEFRRCAHQLAMGLSLESTLRGFALRNPLAEARILSATLAVQRQTGGNLPAALERLARVFRDRLSYQRSFRAATAASRGGLVVIVVIALVLDAYVLILSPEYAQNLIAMGAGRILLGVSLALQAIGILWAYVTLKARY
jgi:Flp pilus assembly protein TadB